jgi:2-iminobutanoate/2-iminopropanoate deaminase
LLFFSVSLSQTQEHDQAAVKKEIIQAALGVPPGLPFSTAVKFGNFVFLSGILGTDLKTSELVSPDVGEQTKQCMETLGLILRQAKMDYSDVVSCTVYLTDLNDYSEMNKAYSAYFPKDPPARTCVQVTKLVRGAKVELSFIAAK